MWFDKIPVLSHVPDYLDKGCVPGGTMRNFDSYGYAFADLSERQKQIICDPQTSGGLLVAVDSQNADEFHDVMYHILIWESVQEIF